MLASFDTGYWTYYALPRDYSPISTTRHYVVQLLTKLAPRGSALRRRVEAVRDVQDAAAGVQARHGGRRARFASGSRSRRPSRSRPPPVRHAGFRSATGGTRSRGRNRSGPGSTPSSSAPSTAPATSRRSRRCRSCAPSRPRRRRRRPARPLPSERLRPPSSSVQGSTIQARARWPRSWGCGRFGSGSPGPLPPPCRIPA